MDLFDASCLAIQVAKRVYELYQTAKSNKDKCALLGKLCNEIGLLLEDNFGNRQNAAKWLGNKVVFDRIESIKFHLLNAEDMIRKFTSKQGLEKGLLLINAFNLDAKFQQMIEDLKDAEQQLVQAISLKAATQLQDNSSQSLDGKQQLMQEFIQAAEQDRKRDTAEIQRMLQVLQSGTCTALQKQQAIEAFVQSSEQDHKKDLAEMQHLLQILRSESVGMLEKQRCIQQFLESAEADRKKDLAGVQKILDVLQDDQVASWEKHRIVYEFLASAQKDTTNHSLQMQHLVKALQSEATGISEKRTSVQVFLQATEQERKKDVGEIQELLQVLQSDSKATWEKQRSIHEFVVTAEQKRKQDADQVKDMLQALQSDSMGILEKQHYVEAFLQSADKDRRKDAEQVQRLLEVLKNEFTATWEKQRSIHEFLTVAEQEHRRDSMDIRKQLDVMHRSESQTLENVQRQLEDMRELLLKQSAIVVGSPSLTAVLQPTAASTSQHSDRDFSFFIEPQHIEYEVSAKKSRGDNRVKLGQGGFGTVYKAMLRRALVVAVKVVDDSGHSRDTIEELKREIRIMSRFSHRNVIGFYGGFYPLQPCSVGEEEEEAYLVMELAENKSFAYHLFGDNRSSTSTEKKIEILSGVADGLCYLHFRNIVHRDIKPDNVLLDRAFIPKLSDFGLAKIKETSLSSRSHAGAVGTLGYQSPEAMQSEKTSFPADIWSFGIMMIECMISERAFAGMNMTQVVATVCVNKKVPLDKIRSYESRWPKEYMELIKGCLRFDLSTRPTAMDLSVIMRGITEKSGFTASYISSLDSLALSEKPDSVDPEPLVSAVTAVSSFTTSTAVPAANVVPTSKTLGSQAIEDLFQSGQNFHFGTNGIKIDYARAVDCYRQAVEYEHPGAQCNFGVCYYKGHGVPQNFQKAMECFLLAANQRHAAARNWLGYCYKNGQGVPQDSQHAIEWFTLAANQGNADSQNWLGYCYQHGHGVARDLAEARKWYQLAADQGNEHTESALLKIVPARPVLQVASGRQVKKLQGNSDHVNSVCWSPDGKLVASGSGN